MPKAGFARGHDDGRTRVGLKGGAQGTDKSGAVAGVRELVEAIHQQQHAPFEEFLIHMSAENRGVLADGFALGKGLE